MELADILKAQSRSHLEARDAFSNPFFNIPHIVPPTSTSPVVVQSATETHASTAVIAEGSAITPRKSALPSEKSISSATTTDPWASLSVAAATGTSTDTPSTTATAGSALVIVIVVIIILSIIACTAACIWRCCRRKRNPSVPVTPVLPQSWPRNSYTLHGSPPLHRSDKQDLFGHFQYGNRPVELRMNDLDVGASVRREYGQQGPAAFKTYPPIAEHPEEHTSGQVYSKDGSRTIGDAQISPRNGYFHEDRMPKSGDDRKSPTVRDF